MFIVRLIPFLYANGLFFIGFFSRRFECLFVMLWLNFSRLKHYFHYVLHTQFIWPYFPLITNTVKSTGYLFSAELTCFLHCWLRTNENCISLCDSKLEMFTSVNGFTIFRGCPQCLVQEKHDTVIIIPAACSNCHHRLWFLSCVYLCRLSGGKLNCKC